MSHNFVRTSIQSELIFLKSFDIIIRSHQLDQRLSEWTWSKLLVFAKWRAKNQDAAIGEFEDYYDDYIIEPGLDPLNLAAFVRSY
jgi:hypothetical protein